MSNFESASDIENSMPIENKSEEIEPVETKTPSSVEKANSFLNKLEQSDIALPLKNMLHQWLQKNIEPDILPAYNDKVEETDLGSISFKELIEIMSDAYLRQNETVNMEFQQGTLPFHQLVSGMFDEAFKQAFSDCENDSQKVDVNALIEQYKSIVA